MFMALLLFLMTILIFWQVFARFVMGSPLSFSEELARFMMVWLAFLGSAYAFRYGSLISMDLLVELFKGVWLKWLYVLIYMISIGFAFILVVYGIDMMIRVEPQVAPSTRLSMMWPYLAVPVGGLLIFMNALSLMIDTFKKN
ncbi:TRAP-type C4-dicarboxylate transport system, small permease component [Geomicrobium sp. JCM 19037]|uniref:TRAP transporter small permease n=1 Tax=Geomicrobium sp. JCM 19037 TaxID=1460634 RepID=UPI00045F1098|nr:TRAP transporter small permease [Geomicrobium sp. JCM 19037]GAK05368.1 TRAP-type C4-dicarboxylate transport system, small permease component [Geomicrobium sp. JCM 19037]